MRSVKEADVRGKRVLVRVDFNVPLKKGKVADDKKIRAVLPTIEFLKRKKAKIVLMSHLGRPKGKVVDDLRLAPIAKHLSKLLKQPVHYEPICTGAQVADMAHGLHPGDVMLLENLRFCPEEEKNDKTFAKQLAALGDIYVNDAFAVSHRAHASVHAVAKVLPSYAGLLLKKEVDTLSRLLKKPKHPFIAIIGGAKVSTKIGVMTHLLKKVDAILIGGAMMFTFYKALGYEVGKSKYEADKVKLAKALLKKGKKKIILPVDVVVASSPKASAKAVSSRKIRGMGFDIGPETAQIYGEIINKAKMVFWNGPMGLFEVKKFAKGTAAVAKAVAKCKGITVVGGGDSVAAIEQLRLEKKFTHVSTGGGALLEFLEGKKLPGIAVLD